jgi:hypothetical protein
MSYTFEPPRKAQVQLILNLNPFSFFIGVKITLFLFESGFVLFKTINFC